MKIGEGRVKKFVVLKWNAPFRRITLRFLGKLLGKVLLSSKLNETFFNILILAKIANLAFLLISYYFLFTFFFVFCKAQ